MRYIDTPVFFRWIYHISYYRAAFQSVVYSIYGLNRQDLYCPEEILYCHYKEPFKFLKEMDMVDVDLVSNISVIVVIWCIMNAATYLTLWLKLNKRWVRFWQKNRLAIFTKKTGEQGDVSAINQRQFGHCTSPSPVGFTYTVIMTYLFFIINIFIYLFWEHTFRTYKLIVLLLLTRVCVLSVRLLFSCMYLLVFHS